MTELVKVQNLIIEYENKYSGIFNADNAIRYDTIYHKEALTELLKRKLPYDEQIDEDIDSIINIASTIHCKVLVDEIAREFISENIKKINHILQFSTISEDSIYKNNDDPFQAFYSTEYVIDALTYEDDPISAFERFIRRQQIKITSGDAAHRFCFIFPKHKFKTNKREFRCNNLFEFMNHCSQYLLDYCTAELVEAISLPIRTIKNTPYTEFSLDYIRTLQGKDLYKYLCSFEYLRINYDLENLYVLLYYNEISLFKDDNTMEFLKQKINGNIMQS